MSAADLIQEILACMPEAERSLLLEAERQQLTVAFASQPMPHPLRTAATELPIRTESVDTCLALMAGNRHVNVTRIFDALVISELMRCRNPDGSIVLGFYSEYEDAKERATWYGVIFEPFGLVLTACAIVSGDSGRQAGVCCFQEEGLAPLDWPAGNGHDS